MTTDTYPCPGDCGLDIARWRKSCSRCAHLVPGEPFIYKCGHCNRTEKRSPVSLGTEDDSARAAGWRIGTKANGERDVVCPHCAGTDLSYWDRQTLAQAHAAGVNAGRPA